MWNRIATIKNDKSSSQFLGSNSVESYYNIEICDAPECYRGAFKKFQESNNADYDTAMFDDMEYENLKMLLAIK